ncbi:MAG: hypothetical protein M1358_16165, partial [Chloroflexi bacterium]|nr:hypothetical protein [Chloroflexota bacterium]
MQTDGQMTPYERVMTVLALGQPDRVPVVPISKVTGIKSAYYTYRDCLADPDNYVESQVQALKEFGFDAVHDASTAPLLAAILGATLVIHDDDPPTVTEPLLKSPDDLNRLQPLGSGDVKWLDYVLAVLRRLKGAVGPEVPVTGLVPSPFLLAGTLRGAEALMRDFFSNRRFIEEPI